MMRERKERLLGLHRCGSVWRDKWLILSLAALAALAATGLAHVIPPTYSASASILVVPAADARFGDGPSFTAQQYFQTQIEIMSARPLVESVLAELSSFDLASSDLRDWRRYVPRALSDVFTTRASEPSRNDSLERYYDHLHIEHVEGTQVIRVTFESSVPALAAAAANAHAEAYVQTLLDAQALATFESTTWKERRLSEVQQTVQRADAEYAALKGLPPANEARKTSVELEALTARLVGLQEWLDARAFAYRQAKSADASRAQLRQMALLLQDQHINQAREAFGSAQQEIATLGRRFGPLHPLMVAAVAERDAAQLDLDTRIARATDEFVNEYEKLKAEADRLAELLVQARAREMQPSPAPSEQALYELFEERLGEIASAKDLRATHARIIESALEPHAPVSPPKALLISGAFVSVLLLGILVRLVNEGPTETLRDPRQVERRLGRALMGAMPVLTQRQLENAREGVIRDAKYETAMRPLREGLTAPPQTAKVVLVTSAARGEGKTTTALNLAATLAKSRRVLIIDANMRQPMLDRLLDIPRYEAGLSELIMHRVPFISCLAKTTVPKLHVIRTGFIPEDPTTLLGHRRFAKILRVLASSYDHIVIDAPPLVPFSDATVLARCVDSVVLVVRANSTPVRHVERALRLLDNVNARVAGIFLNALPVKRRAYLHPERPEPH